MSWNKELAYRYDLFISPEWKERFDTILDENVQISPEGRILDINCGTGGLALELAERARGKGEVVATDPMQERIDLAAAKAQVRKLTNITFEATGFARLPFSSNTFDTVIGDASMLHAAEIEILLREMIRVARPGGLVIMKLTTHGSFDEFFSIYWEALHDCELVDEVWQRLEELIRERSTVSDAEQMAVRGGLQSVQTLTKKEEFFFNTGREFLEAPLIMDSFLDDWLSIVPDEKRQEVWKVIMETIERERHGLPFDISVKATLVSGIKDIKALQEAAPV